MNHESLRNLRYVILSSLLSSLSYYTMSLDYWITCICDQCGHVAVNRNIFSISQMTSLEELELYANDLSRDDKLSDTLSKLTSLKELAMGSCELSQLPDGWVDVQNYSYAILSSLCTRKWFPVMAGHQWCYEYKMQLNNIEELPLHTQKGDNS